MRSLRPGPNPSSTSVPPRVCLFGAAGDTQNLGVSALQEATVQGLLQRLPTAQLTIFDHGNGRRVGYAEPIGASRSYALLGARSTRRLYRPESWGNIRAALRLPVSWNRSAEAIRSADAILDISGGDSFSDLYGLARFKTAVAPKRVALSAGVPLVLLPQTYGPFQTEAVRAEAAMVVRGAASAWARDVDSFERLRELLGDEFDSERHRLGVDVAFALRPQVPAEGWSQPLRSWLLKGRDRPLVGLNVSGLVYFSPDPVRQFGIRLDYPKLMARLVERLLERTDARVVLIPHVLGRGGFESDENAAAELRAQAAGHAGRVEVAPDTVTAGQVKALISALDWFCGTRMHACIAALSSGVPTAGVAYSLKARGVFESVGQASQVVDARADDADDALERLWTSWEGRRETGRHLLSALPAVKRAAEGQMDQIADTITRLADRGVRS